MRLTSDAKGVFPIAPTPFHPDGRIDEASIDRLIAAYREVGTSDHAPVIAHLRDTPRADL